MVKPEIRLFALAALFAIICAVAGVAAADAPAPIVVLPSNPTVVERSAAKELSGELGKCLGETPKIVLETELPGVGSAPRLFVGATESAKKARAGGEGRRAVRVAWRETTSSGDIENRFKSLRK